MKTKTKMINYTGILLVFFLFCPGIYAQFGIGAAGGILYPGLISSEQSNSKFDLGWGYELMLQHHLFQLPDSTVIDARYSFRQFKNPVTLPNILKTWFTFSYLTVNLLVDFYRWPDFALYTDAGGSLFSSHASRDFFDYTGTSFIPELNIGCKWVPTEHYTLFSEISLQFGSLSDIFNEHIPVTGLRFVLGGIMFLSKSEMED